MFCPVCQKEMTVQNLGGVDVDICLSGCKGMWFDWKEINKLDQSNEGLGDALQQALNYPRYNDENRGQINCPKCGIALHRHLFESEKEINADECYICGGFFLDSGELKIIRDNFMSEAEREAYVNRWINQTPVDDKGVLAINNLRTNGIQKYTKFLSANYYATAR
ncbi:MAG: zf-TFIIB domain-containing protein [Candidatus Omnitrophica bacterium]|nr:zf-TFIIB domain-containing protein [Candidatus Omnitrophota bacterium]